MAVSLLSSLSVIELSAIPASNEVFLARQPDGSTICVRLHGDEFFHYTTTADGIVIIENNDDGFYYYASQDTDGQPLPSAVRAADIDKRTQADEQFIRSIDNDGVIRALMTRDADTVNNTEIRRKGPGLFSDATFPTVGKQKAIVILVEYTDEKFRVSDPYDYFNRLLNEKGFSDFGATGSARDYYLESSAGKFDIDFDVYGPVTLPHNRAHYGSNGMSGKDGVNASMMVVDACNIIDKDVDFTQYDRDNDGVIDNVFLFYAGLGEDSGGGSDAVWPHSADAPRGYAFDGKNLQSYGCTNELVPRPTGSRPDGIGAFCHEFGHVLGLPDLYKTASASTEPFTPGAWSLMDRGAHNNERRTPPALDLFSRYALGWWEPQVLDSPTTCVLSPLSLTGEGYLIPTGDNNDFYLVENRQRTGWDTYIPGHGLLVWHVDYDPGVWARFAVNNDASHQHVDIIEADGILSEETRSGDTFPGAANVTSLTSTLYPPLSADNTLTDITENPDGTVTFKFRGGSPAPDAVSVFDATDVTPRSFTARWDASPKATDYRLRVFSRNADGTEKTAPGFDSRLTGNVTELRVKGLEPATKYYYTVAVVDRATESPVSSIAEVTTLPLTHEYVIPEANDAADVTPNSFTASWLPTEGADSYVINVNRVDLDGESTLIEAFDDKIATWNTNSDKFYSNASYVGNKAPSLKLSDGGYISTPMLARGTARSFSFWHRANSADNALICVETYAHGCWVPLKEIAPISAKNGIITTVCDFPSETDAIRIICEDATGTASIFVDDFEVITSPEMKVTPVAGYTDLPVGQALSLPIKGLQPGTHYYFTVRAAKGNVLSMESNRVHVSTPVGAAVKTIYEDSTQTRFSLSGRNVTVISIPDTDVTVYNLNGITIEQTRTDNEGNATTTLPCQGIYMIKCGKDIFKVFSF